MSKLQFNKPTEFVQENGGRAVMLFLLFLLALYEFKTMGLTGFALICILPAVPIVFYVALKNRMLVFWAWFFINYSIMGLNRYIAVPVPVTALILLPQILLLIVLLIDDKETGLIQIGSPMGLAILIWSAYLILEIFNRTCDLPFNFGMWFTNFTFFGLFFIFVHVLVTALINTPTQVMRFLRFWAYCSIVASLWAWRQKTFGFDETEMAWLNAGGRTTHIIGGSIRYFSMFTDAANFGCSIASAAVAFYILGITAKLKKDKRLFYITALLCTYGLFTSGTRSAILCLIVGIFVYIFLSKSFKIAIPVVMVGGTFLFLLACTNIGQGNMQIRRMRTAFDPNDASKSVRDINKEAMKKYLQDAPFGLGINIDESSIPTFHKYKIVIDTSNDSTYVFFWQRIGIVGASIFAFFNFLIFAGGCRIVLFRLQNNACKGIGAAFCCALVAINAGGYTNHILLQYPNLLLFYGGMAIVYLLPKIENEYIAYEQKLFDEQEERKRLKLEKKRASRV